MNNNLIPNDYIEIKELKDIQDILTYMLFSFNKICVENKITYNIYAGTLLGAVRHKGFIPWDDDIDVAVPREDYIKLPKIFENNKEFSIKKYTDSNYPYPFMKMCLKNSLLIENNLNEKYNKLGIYIDIFPVDGYPKNDWLFFKFLHIFEHVRYMTTLNKDYLMSITNKYLYRTKEIIISLKPNVKKLLIIEDKLLSKSKVENSDYLYQYAETNYKHGKIKKEDFFDRQLYNFANIYVYGVKDYDKQLKTIYGDYQKLPKIEDRVRKHNYVAYLSKAKLIKIRSNKYI